MLSYRINIYPGASDAVETFASATLSLNMSPESYLYNVGAYKSWDAQSGSRKAFHGTGVKVCGTLRQTRDRGLLSGTGRPNSTFFLVTDGPFTNEWEICLSSSVG